MRKEKASRSILWVSSSKRDLMDMPADVVADFGYGLYRAQLGEYPDMAKTLLGFGGGELKRQSRI